MRTTTQVRVDSLAPGDAVRRFRKIYYVWSVDSASDFAWTVVYYARHGEITHSITRPYATASKVSWS